MLISGRQAAEWLAARGLPREQARRLLLAGFAGPGLRTRAALLYDANRVRELVQRPEVTSTELRQACPRGAFVLRAWRGIDVSPEAGRSHADLLSVLRLNWWLSPWARVLLTDGVERDGFFPFLTTVSGHVALGGVIVRVTARSEYDHVLTVAEPGGWFAPLAGRQVWTGAGGPWVLWAARAALQQ